MPLLHSIIAFVQRRIISLIPLLPYFLLWVWFYDFLNYISEDPSRSCGAANGFAFILLITVSGLYLIAGISMLLLSKDQKRRDFKVIVAVILVPILIGLVDLFT